ncbi:RusA family crossover junction endodeoxyribonuclease [Alkalibacillus salilacus]|uniref:Holliday junction resolvase RusA-like endonuclease n=1 Tax=Alkalibacillus salilacus TaxID=284582 RepID=A0ABT9VDG8_9BACI|nr:RusA family crossover junction endodeoxyribonuclease [Alkalibacillus salilacus]MDQ0158997.1 Holliday junction resolvase RusA-like endonuclease [Alkalibacillus salilacus]
MIAFTIHGQPVAQGRARATTFKGQARMYDPAKSKHYKHYVQLSAAQHKPSNLLKGPIDLTVRVYRPIPKSMPKYKRKLIDDGQLRPTTKPDVDNYLKAIKDALNGIIWHDDSQVVNVHIEKYYDDQPRVEVEIREWEADTCT